ncbi:MAG: lysophospholipid acyltransferase family protein [Planctomycetota bacterium]|jgi:1-acyl-sn-glycerol-3-phosphate acyltransferase
MQMRELEAGYRFRPARPNRFWQGVLTPLRRRISRRTYRVAEIEIRGREHLDAVRSEDGPTMVTVNHPAHGDPFVILEAMHRLRVSCCYLAAWQVFRGWWGLRGWAFQRMGAFSVDREGTDVRSFRTAVDILADGTHALVVFPEGEVYHLNDRVTPLREGAAMIAISAVRRCRRSGGSPLRLVPCGLKYFHLEDPTPLLEPIMARLERRVYWRPQAQRSLPDRIYRYAEAILALKELEYLDGFGTGPLPQRVASLSERILADLEERRLGAVAAGTIPVRVKQLRQRIMQELPGIGPAGGADAEDDGPPPAGAPTAEALAQARRDLDDLHLVTQLFSYPGDYVAQKPSIERIAETLAKFEEDALGVEDATAKTDRRVVVSFGPPVDVSAFVAEASGPAREVAGALTVLMEQRIQGQLDSIAPTG